MKIKFLLTIFVEVYDGYGILKQLEVANEDEGSKEFSKFQEGYTGRGRLTFNIQEKTLDIRNVDFFKFLGKKGYICFWTGNMTLTQNGFPVMGAGLAKQIAEQVPGVKFQLGQELKKLESLGQSIDKYGNPCIIKKPSVIFINEHFGMIPVKYGWWENANLDLIRYSLQRIRNIAENCPDKTIVFNYPGIGAGHLKEEDVRELLFELLEDTMTKNIIIVKKEVSRWN
jgi:hypothetical protein